MLIIVVRLLFNRNTQLQIPRLFYTKLEGNNHGAYVCIMNLDSTTNLLATIRFELFLQQRAWITNQSKQTLVIYNIYIRTAIT